VRLELRNIAANYPFETSHRFPGIKPNSGHRDYSRLSCGGGKTQLGALLAKESAFSATAEQALLGFAPGFSLRRRPNFLVLVVHRVVPAKLATRKSDGFAFVENARTGSLRARMTRPALVSKCTLNGAGSGWGSVVD
jgi:hypothetical protein